MSFICNQGARYMNEIPKKDGRQSVAANLLNHCFDRKWLPLTMKEYYATLSIISTRKVLYLLLKKLDNKVIWSVIVLIQTLMLWFLC